MAQNNSLNSVVFLVPPIIGQELLSGVNNQTDLQGSFCIIPIHREQISNLKRIRIVLRRTCSADKAWDKSIITPAIPRRDNKQRDIWQDHWDVCLDQSAACRCRDFMDGRHALSAAVVRLSLRSGDWLKAIGNVQGDG